MANNIITKTWINTHETAIQEKLQPLADTVAVRTLQSAPTENTLTFLVGEQVHSYKVGDEVRVVDNNADAGYVYYKLYNIIVDGNNRTAVWQSMEVSDSTIAATIKVSLEAIVNGTQASGTDLLGTEVSVSATGVDTETQVWQGEELTFCLIPQKAYTISVGNVDGYAKPSSYTTSTLDYCTVVTRTFQYEADEYTVSVSSNQGALDNDISSGRLVYNNTNYANGSTFKVPTGTSITTSDLGAVAVTGYTPLIDITNKAISLEYQTEVLHVTITVEDNEGDISESTITVTDSNSNTLGVLEDGDSLKIPYETQYTCTPSAAPEGYDTPTVEAYTASQVSRSLTFEYTVKVNGVYAYYTNGKLKGISEASNSAIGVAVITDDYKFIIDKADGGQLNFGGYWESTGTGVLNSNNLNTAKTDFAGDQNTTWIINCFYGYTDDEGYSITGAPAAEWTRNQFNGRGYLPSLGEMLLAYDYKTEIDTMLTAIGGTAFQNSYYWCSTQYNTTVQSWAMIWSNGYTSSAYRYGNFYTRAFRPFTIGIPITLSATDGSSINGKYVTLIDSTGYVQYLYASSGKVTAYLPLDTIEVRVKNHITLTKSITIDMTTKNATINFCTPEVGIYAYYSDGTMLSEEDADTNAIGVAVITSNCCFVISKTENDGNQARGVAFGGIKSSKARALSGIGIMCTDVQSQAQEDYLGENNTVRIINACKGYASAPAAEWCRTQFDGRGYLGSFGEWYTVYSNLTTINNMMSKIGGTSLSKYSEYWTSTLHYEGIEIWAVYLVNGNGLPRGRDNGKPLRAFCAL